MVYQRFFVTALRNGDLLLTGQEGAWTKSILALHF